MQQLLTELRRSDGDEPFCPLRKRCFAQVCHTEFSYHHINVTSPNGGGVTL